MKRLISVLFIIGQLILGAPSAFATLLLEDAVEEYVAAVESGDPEEIEKTWKDLNDNESFISYLIANKPDLYERLKQKHEDRYKNLAVTDERESWDISDRAQDFPAADRRDNRAIARDEPNTARWDNAKVSRNFPNQERPSNQDIIRQRRRQDRAGGYVRRVEENIGHEQTVVLTVSGVDRYQRDALLEILKDEFLSIKSVEELNFDRGVMVLLLELDSNTDEFSERLRRHTFPAFNLNLVRFRPNRIDFFLKHK